MPRTMYLHVGLPKTASTFLQTQFFPSLSEIRFVSTPESGGYFVDDGKERLLNSIFSRSETIWKHHADPLLDMLLGSDWRDDDRDILLSDEAIGRTASRQGRLGGHLIAMQTALAQRGIGRLKLLCLIRRQDHWLASHYAQIERSMRDAGQADFEALVARIADPRRDRFKFGALLDHASTHAAMCAALGEDHVAMVPMEWLSVDEPAIRRAFAEWLDLNPEDVPLQMEKGENVRRSGERTWTVRTRPWARIARTILRRSPHIRLSPDLSQRILSLYQASNLELAERTGLDLRRLGYFAEERTVG